MGQKLLFYVFCFPSQYLFPDAAVEKSSENNKTKAEGLDSSGNVEQDKNSDNVSWFSCSMDWALTCHPAGDTLRPNPVEVMDG